MISDHGMGIAEADMQRIFEPFERVESKDVPDGLGLGLYIAKQLASAHAGTLEASSVPGAGAVFRLRLPLVS